MRKPDAVLLILLVLAAPVLCADPPQEGHGVGSRTEVARSLEDPVLRARFATLKTNLICACKSENWSKTLAHCPDACADPQKSELTELLRAGKSDSEIYAVMEQRYGPKVLARPGLAGAGGASLLYLPAILAAVGVAVAAVVAIALVRRSKSAVPAKSSREAPATADEIARVERELEGS